MAGLRRMIYFTLVAVADAVEAVLERIVVDPEAVVRVSDDGVLVEMVVSVCESRVDVFVGVICWEEDV